MTAEDRIRAALKERQAKLDECPINKRSWRGGRDPCPTCKAGPGDNCTLNTLADAAFVDAIKEIVA